jgi:hypothetical protein
VKVRVYSQVLEGRGKRTQRELSKACCVSISWTSPVVPWDCQVLDQACEHGRKGYRKLGASPRDSQVLKCRELLFNVFRFCLNMISLNFPQVTRTQDVIKIFVLVEIWTASLLDDGQTIRAPAHGLCSADKCTPGSLVVSTGFCLLV